MNVLFERLQQLPAFVTVTLLNPSWNPKAAWALYASIATFVLLLACVIALFVLSLQERRRAAASEASAEGATPRSARTRRSVPPLSTPAKVGVSAAGLLVLLGIWLMTGALTSSPETCRSCHWASTAHARIGTGSDPHAEVTCVSCHEPGGAFGRYVSEVPLRVLHVGLEPKGGMPGSGYGRVTVSACRACHEDAMPGTVTVAKRGLRMSHREPISASATCVDCHSINGGVVASYNGGMAICLRCHDSKVASAKCPTCHEENASAAARVRTVSFQAAQIKQVDCGGCHNEKRECDPCHGLRMPHTTDFMAHNHARAAIVDFWYNDGKTCGACHTQSRRSCRCHTSQIGGAHGQGRSFLLVHKQADSAKCNTCHARFAYVTTRDFCRDVCHSRAAKAASPR